MTENTPLVLGTTEISLSIENLLKTTTFNLIIVSPYLKLNPRLRAMLADTLSEVTTALFFFRENELRDDEKKWLNEFDNVALIPVKNLHAKIYLGDNTAILTSMNLYEYSQINNHEIGVVLKREDSQNAFLKIIKEIRLMLAAIPKVEMAEKLFDEYEDYTMRSLFHELGDKFPFKGYNKGSNNLYQFFCDRAMEIVEFEDAELYQDKTAVLRTTLLGKERYKKLYRKIKEMADFM
jgi:phosphatidylserine/phosphatidylglycerophosphate/cardiolipin synthase-like enzyme